MKLQTALLCYAEQFNIKENQGGNDIKIIGKISLALGVAALLILTGTGIAAPAENNQSQSQSNSSFIDQALQSWRGFATNDKESHVLTVSIESTSTVDPVQIRKLMEAHAGLDEIYSQVGKVQSGVVSKGYLRLGKVITGAKINPNGTGITEFTAGDQEIYELVNMKMNPSENYTVIDSDIADRGYSEKNSTAKIEGHITLNAADLDPTHYAELSEGQLTMNGGLFAGKYKVLLETDARRMLFVNQSHKSAFGNESNGIDLIGQDGLLGQGDILSQAFGPTIDASQNDKQIRRVFIRRTSGNQSSGIGLPIPEDLMSLANETLINSSQGGKQIRMVLVRKQT